MLKVTRRSFMAGTAALALTAAARPSRPSRLPNIIFIMVDDLGYGDLSRYGRTEYATPNIDSIGQSGCTFSDAYANSPVCSPTRFSLMTGRYQYRLPGGLEEPIAGPRPVGLSPEHPSLPSLLRAQGYRTALVGKWHLGAAPNFGPLKSGYDSFLGIHDGGVDYFSHTADMDGQGPSALYDGDRLSDRKGYLTDLLTERAISEIEQAANVGRPLFLSLHYTAPHWPWEGPGDKAVSENLRSLYHYDGGSDSTYAKMMVALDEGVGKVLSALEEQGIAQDTIVIFTSDNGGERFSKTWPFDGMKGDLLEGGIRVPLMIRWPRRIAPNMRTDQVALTMDFLPTLLAAAGSAPDPSAPSDGMNILPVLEGAPAVERTVFWRFKAREQAAMRQGGWKMLKVNGNSYLFNLADDKQERANLKKHYPERMAQMEAAWDAWNANMLPYPEGSISANTHGKGVIAAHD